MVQPHCCGAAYANLDGAAVEADCCAVTNVDLDTAAEADCCAATSAGLDAAATRADCRAATSADDDAAATIADCCADMPVRHRLAEWDDSRLKQPFAVTP